jgi:FKBP-type peptidyl-prolyl cis-trans isomerase 2
LITRTWTVEDGKVVKTTQDDDGNPPLVDEESSMSSLDDALTEEKDGTCKKIKTAMCEE